MNSLDGNQDKVSTNKALKSILQQEAEQTDRQIDRHKDEAERRKREEGSRKTKRHLKRLQTDSRRSSFFKASSKRAGGVRTWLSADSVECASNMCKPVCACVCGGLLLCVPK